MNITLPINVMVSLASPAVRCACGHVTAVLARPQMSVEVIKAQVVASHNCEHTRRAAATLPPVQVPTQRVNGRQRGPQGVALAVFNDPFAGMVDAEDDEEAMGLTRSVRRRRRRR